MRVGVLGKSGPRSSGSEQYSLRAWIGSTIDITVAISVAVRRLCDDGC